VPALQGRAVTKDRACTVREIGLEPEVDVPGFVRVLDSYVSGPFVRIMILCDDDPIIWRLRFEVAPIDAPRPCLTGLTYVGRRGLTAIFHHPPARAGDEPWQPNRADMTLVEP
jgi:hypothetical protein